MPDLTSADLAPPCTCANCTMTVEDGDYRCVVCHDIGLRSEAHGELDALKCWRCDQCPSCQEREHPDECPFAMEMRR